MKENFNEQFNAEIEMANNARAKGNEGMARVCARRALGLVIGEYFRKNNMTDPSPNAFDRIKTFINTPSIPEEYRKIATNFTVRVTPNFHLPIDIDLIEEVKLLRTKLLEEK